VFVRIKPLQRRKEEEPSIVQRMDNTIFVKDIDYKFADKEKNYTFNEVIAEDMNNIDTFEHAIEVTPYAYAAQPSLKHLLDGYNVAILAYGITGSGKTHTVFGNTQNPADYGLCT
jgi:kinesin family protein 18/19